MYTDELADAILAELATSSAGLNSICAREDFPHPATVYRWVLDRPGFCEKYTRAKEHQTTVLEEEILQIADNTQLGEVVTLKADGTEERKMADMLEHRKLKIESRKWLMGKLRPKKYGDRQAIEVSGELALAERISKARQRVPDSHENS